MMSRSASNMGPKLERIWCAPALALLCALFATNVYRAATQSITIDEAVTYDHFVAGTKPGLEYNNHPLNTLLCKVSTQLLGVSELTLRLPSLLAGLLYFFALYRLAVLLFGRSIWMLLAVGLNSLNPFLLDHLSAARGYGMGIAFWTLGAYYLVRWSSEKSSRTWRVLMLAGAALGFAVGSHLTQAFAAAALVGSFAAIYIADSIVNSGWAACWKVVSRSVIPLAAVTAILGLVLAAPVLGVPDVGDGLPHYRDGWIDLLQSSLLYKLTLLTSWKPVQPWIVNQSWVMLRLFAALVVCGFVLALRRWIKARNIDDLELRERHLLLFSGAMLLVAVFVWIEPRLLHHPYHTDRRLLFAYPLMFLLLPMLFRRMTTALGGARIVAAAATLPLAVLCVQFALEFNVGYYLEWKPDAGTKRIAQLLRKEHGSASAPVLRVASDWMIVDGLNFYRKLYRLDWMPPVTRDAPGCGHDYYAVRAEQLDALSRFNPEPILRDSISGIVLAQRSAGVRQRLSAFHELGLAGPVLCEATVARQASWAEMGRPDIAQYLARDFMQCSDRDSMCWTYEHPALLFIVPRRQGAVFKMDFRLPASTFQRTGPQRLTVRLNGKWLGDALYTSPEEHTFERAVPAEYFRDDGIALIETTLDKYFVSDRDGQKLGYLFVRGGFVNARQVSTVQ